VKYQLKQQHQLQQLQLKRRKKLQPKEWLALKSREKTRTPVSNEN
jgi:hypothetical protein